MCPSGEGTEFGATDELDEGVASECLFHLDRRQSSETF